MVFQSPREERSILQETLAGDFAIRTFDGDNPAERFGKIMANTELELAAFAREAHGLYPDTRTPATPTLIIDRES